MSYLPKPLPALKPGDRVFCRVLMAHSENGRRKCSRGCPAALALAARFEVLPAHVAVACDTVEIRGEFEDYVFRTSKPLRREIRQYDQGAEFRPGLYRLTAERVS